MENLDEMQLVQMKLSNKDLERVEVLKQLTGETNRTQIVMTVLELAELVIKNMKNGNNIAIEHPNQRKEYIRMT